MHYDDQLITEHNLRFICQLIKSHQKWRKIVNSDCFDSLQYEVKQKCANIVSGEFDLAATRQLVHAIVVHDEELMS